jgi:Copper transport outer membrane protein, MctB
VIDFRYHLVSIVAVFLALGIGILMGSLVLGEALVKQLRSDLEGIEDRNDRLRAETIQLTQQLEDNEQFALDVRPYLIGGRLDTERIVMFVFEGTDGEMVDRLRESITDSGGVIATTVTLRDKLAITSPAERDELGLLLDVTTASARELQNAVGTQLGSRFAAAAESPAGLAAARSALDELVRALEDAGYIDVDGADDQPLAPPNAVFVIAGGAVEPPAYDVTEVAVPLARELSAEGAGVVAAETSSSSWELVQSIRNDPDTNATVATVDQGESISGGIGVVMALDLAENGIVRHIGTASGSEAIIPVPTASP